MLPGLVLTGAVNTLIVRSPTYTNFTPEEFSVLTGDPAPKPVYSGQALLAITGQGNDRRTPGALPVAGEP